MTLPKQAGVDAVKPCFKDRTTYANSSGRRTEVHLANFEEKIQEAQTSLYKPQTSGEKNTVIAGKQQNQRPALIQSFDGLIPGANHGPPNLLRFSPALRTTGLFFFSLQRCCVTSSASPNQSAASRIIIKQLFTFFALELTSLFFTFIAFESFLRPETACL